MITILEFILILCLTGDKYVLCSHHRCCTSPICFPGATRTSLPLSGSVLCGFIIHIYDAYIPRDPLFILGLNATLIGITLIVIAKICFKDAGFGSHNKRRHILEETLLKKLGEASRRDIDDDQSFEVIQPTNTNKKE